MIHVITCTYLCSLKVLYLKVNLSLYLSCRISIVDLAGSERSKKTGATGDRCKEAGSINNSLHVLGRCIEAMRHNQRVSKKSEEMLIPFRDSKLTKLLQTYFVGKGKAAREGKVVMVLNVSNNASVFSETAHVLKFSALASKVRYNYMCIISCLLVVAMYAIVHVRITIHYPMLL